MNASNKNSQAYIIYICLFLIYFFVSAHLAWDFHSGGNPSRQGDWLINNEHDLTRRGLLGSVLIYISDLTSADLLLLVILLQWLLFSTVYFVILYAIYTLGATASLAWLALSPGFIFLFWFNSYAGAFRKELILYALFCSIILLQALNIRSKYALLFGSTAFVFSVFSYEVSIFFLPFFLMLLSMYGEGLGKRDLYFSFALTLIGSTAGFLFTVLFATSANSALVCQSLLERGLSDHICSGAIAHVSDDLGYAFQLVGKHLNSPRIIFEYICIYVLALIPFLHFAYRVDRRFAAYGALSIFAFFPLFFIAVDWGRWVSCSVTIITFLLIQYLLKNRDSISLNYNCSRRSILFMMLYSLFWGVDYMMGGFIEGGAIRILIATIYDVYVKFS